MAGWNYEDVKRQLLGAFDQQREAARSRQNLAPSVVMQVPQAEWQPEYQKEPGLEASNPEDFIPGPGTMKALALKAAAAAKALPAVAMVGATRWQGSPNHIKGTAFDMSKLGTGEGAQVNGFGHYVAESPAVGDRYRESLAIRKLMKKIDNHGVESYDDLPPIRSMTDLNTPEQRLMAALKKEEYLGYDNPIHGLAAASRSDARTAYDIAPHLEESMRRMGHLYKVDVPDEALARTINFEKSLGEQPHLAKLVEESGLQLSPTDTGRDLYKNIEARLGKAGAQKWFDSRNIPGITYLDAGSRRGGGTTNNVLFNDKLARILERNGKPTGEKAWLPGEYDYTPPTEARKDEAVAAITKFLQDKLRND